MRIMLVQPRMNMRPMDTKLKIRMAPSLALLTLVRLTPNEHEVFLVNENIDDINFDAKVDLVALTVTLDVLPRAAVIAKTFKMRGIPSVAGGIHISAAPIESGQYFDSVCVGPAERVWNQMLLDCENGTLKKMYSDMENFKGEEICSPDYDAIDKNKYMYTNIISTGRGCPFKCDFCYNSGANSTWHVNRPVDRVIDEILSLKVRHVMFVDDNFIGNPSWTREFLYKLLPLKIKWNAAVTANILNDLELLDLMKVSGCQSLFIGFESVNSGSIQSVHKKQNDVTRYDILVSEIHKREIMINASLVFGLPCDDEKTFESTLNWLVKNKIETVTAHILTPYPGTVLHEKMKVFDKIIDFDLSHYNTAHVVFRHEVMTSEQLAKGYLKLYEDFYTLGNILRRLPDSKSQRIPFLLFNFFYRKFGKFTEWLSSWIPLHRIGQIALRLSYYLK